VRIKFSIVLKDSNKKIPYIVLNRTKYETHFFLLRTIYYYFFLFSFPPEHRRREKTIMTEYSIFDEWIVR
jgi:hypothetical protein